MEAELTKVFVSQFKHNPYYALRELFETRPSSAVRDTLILTDNPWCLDLTENENNAIVLKNLIVKYSTKELWEPSDLLHIKGCTLFAWLLKNQFNYRWNSWNAVKHVIDIVDAIPFESMNNVINCGKIYSQHCELDPPIVTILNKYYYCEHDRYRSEGGDVLLGTLSGFQGFNDSLRVITSDPDSGKSFMTIVEKIGRENFHYNTWHKFTTCT